MYGSSLGHVHPKADFKVQEIYEFSNFGGMLVSFEDYAKLFVCKLKEKVVVPPDCMMTILNFSIGRLETLDMANPLQNESSKDILRKKGGPMIAIYNTGLDRGEKSLSRMCDSFLSYRFKKKVIFPYSGDVKIRLNKNYEVFGIEDDAEIDIKVGICDGDLVNEILKREEEFREYNIKVEKGNVGLSHMDEDGELHVMNITLEKLVGLPCETIKEMLRLNEQ